MKIRPAASVLTLDESMERACDIASDWRSVLAYINAMYPFLLATRENTQCQFYCLDMRTGWRTYLITVDHAAVLFCDRRVSDDA